MSCINFLRSVSCLVFTQRQQCVRQIYRLSIFFLLIGLGNLATAGTFLAYGPETFQRTHSEISDTFEASFNILNPNTNYAFYTLEIYSGGIPGSETTGRKVTAATIYINGQKVAGPNLFHNKKTTLVTIPVNLQTDNHLTLELKGKPTSLLTLQIIGNPVTVQITDPATLITVGSTPIEVNGTVSDPAASLTLNGAPVDNVNGTFTAQVSLEEGLNTIVARAVNGKGGDITDSIVVSMDLTPPYITIESPLDGQTVRADAVSVSGLVNDIVRGTVAESQANVLVNGIEASVSNRSYLAENVPLMEGDNLITISAADQVGNTAATSIHVRYEPLSLKHIELTSGQGQQAQIRSALPDPLTVRLIGNDGLPVPNNNVVFRVIQGDGVLQVGADAPAQGVLAVTNEDGIAQAYFDLGSRSGVGNHRVRATAVGFDGEVLFHASANTNLGDKVSVNSGNNQRGAVNQPLPQPFVVAVTDEGANVVQGAQVEFRVTRGGGRFQNDATMYTTQTDSDGRGTAHLTLGPEVGFDVQRVSATLVGTALNAGFTASGLQSGDPGDTRITGIVFDNQDTPLPGVTIRVDGTTRQGVTDEQGQFIINQVPVGPVHLLADGSTTTVAGEWPTLSYNLVTIAGAENPLPSPVYMVRLDTDNAVLVGREDRVITLPDLPGFELEVRAGSVTFPDGSHEGLMSVTPVNADKVPMAPPNGMQPQLIVTIQPAGTRFDPPAPLTLPNVDGHLPGAQVEMYSYDHDLEEFVSIGLGKVSTDGSVIRSINGVGVIKAGWHCGSQPSGSGCADACPYCDDCTGECNCDLVPKRELEQQSATDCRNNYCDGTWAANDGETPTLEDAPNDCKVPACKGGDAIQDISLSDSDAPAEECKECKLDGSIGNLADGPLAGDKCKLCENGVLNVWESGDWLDDDSLSASVTLPDNLKQRVQDTINLLPGINIQLSEANVQFTGKGKACCKPADGPIELGKKEGEISLNLKASLKDVKLWPAVPTAFHKEKEFDAFGVIVRVEVRFQAGVFFKSDIVVGATGGIREDTCGDENCSFGSVAADIGVGFEPTVNSYACLDSTATDKYCAVINVTPAAILSGLEGGLTFNKPLCGSGFSGVVGLKPVVFQATFAFPGLGSISYTEQIYPF